MKYQISFFVNSKLINKYNLEENNINNNDIVFIKKTEKK